MSDFEVIFHVVFSRSFRFKGKLNVLWAFLPFLSRVEAIPNIKSYFNNESILNVKL